MLQINQHVLGPDTNMNNRVALNFWIESWINVNLIYHTRLVASVWDKEPSAAFKHLDRNKLVIDDAPADTNVNLKLLNLNDDDVASKEL